MAIQKIYSFADLAIASLLVQTIQNRPETFNDDQLLGLNLLNFAVKFCADILLALPDL